MCDKHIVEGVTSELNGFLEPYLRKQEYGDLRTAEAQGDSFPAVYENVVVWFTIYVLPSKSSMINAIALLDDGGWGRTHIGSRFSEKFGGMEEAILSFKERVLNIPKERANE